MVTAKQAKAVAERYQKAVELVEQGKVYPVHRQPGCYAVVNGDGSEVYLVTLGRCSCPDYVNRGEQVGCCKHTLATELYAQRQPKGDGDAPKGKRRKAEREAGASPQPPAACAGCGRPVEGWEGGLCTSCAAAAYELLYGEPVYEPA